MQTCSFNALVIGIIPLMLEFSIAIGTTIVLMIIRTTVFGARTSLQNILISLNWNTGNKGSILSCYVGEISGPLDSSTFGDRLHAHSSQ